MIPKQFREVKTVDLVTYTLLSPLVILAIWILTPLVLVERLSLPPWIIYTIAAVLTYVPLKRSVIGAVLAYKAFMPMKVRDRCRFVPTCSTYMIMAINKYGLFIGVIKGIKRLMRCKPPNGGVDYP